MCRYVSVVIACPYSGTVQPEAVRDVSRALLDMGCYEVSLGDTVGMGTPATVRTMLETVMGGSKGLPAEKLAVSSPPTILRIQSFTQTLADRATSMIPSAPPLRTL